MDVTFSESMTDPEAEDLAGSIANHAQGHFPGMDIETVADRIHKALTNPDSGYVADDDRACYIKDGIVVLVNPLEKVDGGTAYPSDDPQADLDKFIQDNPTPKGSEGE